MKIHGRVTKGTYWHLVEKVQKRVANWKVRHLSMAGREILIKSSSTPIALYNMQTANLPVSVKDRMDSINRSFLWGSIEGQKRIHLIDWDTVCSPKLVGGLGLRKMRDWNEVALAKLAWRFLTEKEALWVKCLGAKYLCSDKALFDVDEKGNISQVWRSLLSGRELLKKGIAVRIGDGNHAKFWSDAWCNNETLQSLVARPIPDEQALHTVRYYWTGMNWNFDLLRSWLDDDSCNLLRSYACANLGDITDEITWNHTSNGIFTMKSAYELLISRNLVECPITKIIWKLPVLPRVRTFLWIMWRGRLLTNEQRLIRHMTNDDSCCICGWHSEDHVHALRDCTKARNVWESWVPLQFAEEFFASSGTEWLEFNLLDMKNAVVNNMPWPAVFATICWRNWSWRNERIMAGIDHSLEAREMIVHKSLLEVLSLSNAAIKMPRCEVLLHWDRPADGWVKVNSDGSWSQAMEKAGAGGVIRDHCGNWIMGYERRCGNCSIDRAELWGILQGLKIAWNNSFRKVELESDSATSVDMISKGVNIRHPLHDLVFSIQQLLMRQWECTIKYVPREKNMAADWFAKHSLEDGDDLVIFDIPPMGVRHLLLADSLFISFPRFVRQS